MTPEFCADPSQLTWFSQAQCGIASVLSVPFGTASDVAGAGAEAVGNAAAQVGQTVRDVAATAGDTVKESANPLNLLGLGLGVSAGGVAATVVVVGGGAIILDQLLTGGAGLAAIGRTVTMQRARRKG